MSEVEIFKTNVSASHQAEEILGTLHFNFPTLQFNFDLDDTDKILRAEGPNIEPATIISFVQNLQFDCEHIM